MPTLPTIPTTDDDPFKPEMDQGTTEKCLRYWMKELQLSDWCIDVQYSPPHELDDEAAGSVIRSNPLRLAEVKLMYKADYDKEERWCPYDAEVLLVHELLHLVFWHIEGRKLSNGDLGLLERAIETLTYVLVRQRRMLLCNG